LLGLNGAFVLEDRYY